MRVTFLNANTALGKRQTTSMGDIHTVHAWLGCCYNGKRFQNPE